MKLLWLSHFCPFPPVGGASQRSFNLLRYLSQSHEICLVILNHHDKTTECLHDCRRELKKYCEEVEIWPLPYPRRSLRWWGELCLNPFFSDPFACRTRWSRRLAARWQRILHEHPEALLHFDSSDLAGFARFGNGFRKVLNHHNCESAMAVRRAKKETNPIRKAYLWLQARKLAELEQKICHRFEVNTVVSELDAQLLRATAPQAHIHVVENGTDTTYFLPAKWEGEPRSLVFAGSLRWYPNLSAIQFFGREIWPLLKQQIPDARLYLAGQSPPRWLAQWAGRQADVILVASPADIRPWVARAAVFICPIVDGGGTRLKILDALAMGKTVVSTTIGCEGLGVRHGENILIADTPRDFASAVVRALGDELLRHRLGAAGRALVESKYSWQRIVGQLDQAYRCAIQGGVCDERPAERVEVEA